MWKKYHQVEVAHEEHETEGEDKESDEQNEPVDDEQKENSTTEEHAGHIEEANDEDDKKEKDDNNNKQDEEDNTIFITQSTFVENIDNTTFDLNFDELIVFPSPTIDTCSESEDDYRCPKRQCREKDRRNSIYAYFPILEKWNK